MLELRGVTKVYETGGIKRTVLNDVNLNFRVSEFAAILGPSGSGKTTLLNIIGGLDHYTTGDLIINEKSTKKFKDKDWDSYRNHRIGFVFQSYNLIPHQTVLQNVRLALTLSGISKRESIIRAKKALKDVGLEEHIDKRPSQLSGGQMQRVAIARALVNDPDILLADEPTGALDSETSLQIMELLKEIAKEKLVIMVTHNPELADKYATRIIRLKDGRITADSNKYDGSVKTDLDASSSGRKSKKTKMSFFTALSLSLKNLLTKKARTILVAFAGSIGIIGIALISAVSTGFQNYIDHIEETTLTSYPLIVSKESADITGMLLSLTGATNNNLEGDYVDENRLLTSMLGSVSSNDLKSFETYMKNHENDIKGDLRAINYTYNVDPPIYTIDATNKPAKLNPNSLFSTFYGNSTIMSSYSNLTSIYEQHTPEVIEDVTRLVAGRFPEKYNEMLLVLTDPHEISDLLTYSLGYHDTSELANIFTKVMSGESVQIEGDPLKLTYEELMGKEYKLIYPFDLYKYNAKYDVYEDMSEDEAYMKELYEKAETLKIVGIAKPRDDMSIMNSGIIYLPELVTHIIERSSEAEITKKQLASPTIDVFSNTKFGEKNNDFNFSFSDLVSVDSNKLAKVFNINIDQNMVSAKTMDYMNKISDSIDGDARPIRKELDDKLTELSPELMMFIAGKSTEEDFDMAKVPEYIDEFVASKDFSEFENKYLIPAASFAQVFSGVLKLGFAGGQEDMINKTLDEFSIAILEVKMKSEILTKVGELSSYLTSSFANAFSIDESAFMDCFTLNFTEDELARVVTAMFTKSESTLDANLSAMGYQNFDDPTYIQFYFNSFDGKTHFVNFLDDYNEFVKTSGQEEKEIKYTDITGVLMSSVKTIVDAVSYVLIAFVSISLIVSSIMIGVITYISVYERTKEIGILRAIGASKHNISNIFNAETFIIGFLSGLFGIGISYILIPIINLILHYYTGDIPLSATLAISTAAGLVVLSVVLTLIGGLIPARSASKKDPVEALRSE
ncbi:ABC transporter ATP-binding protein/permease [Candidatus Saccharibacteria bacterium]|nr:ABC transporter ATP-binding protein/permease [Candidatus Saccharibacteria bacterium]